MKMRTTYKYTTQPVHQQSQGKVATRTQPPRKQKIKIQNKMKNINILPTYTPLYVSTSLEKHESSFSIGMMWKKCIGALTTAPKDAWLVKILRRNLAHVK
jgi:hypothetical protein